MYIRRWGWGERLGQLIGNPDPPPRSHEPPKDAGDHRGGVGAADWRPLPQIYQDLELDIWSIQGLGAPIGDPDPTLEVLASSVDVGNLGGGFGVADRRPKPLLPFFSKF
ncbi:hypothetical protein CRG98_014743 [Punica granatum]|uniref:Uncharacterized protein n=1 Tax=Punica granatum TaxID=22663 RepID=A0A2I0K8E7_PUNGR|nr:hypothetical protein CRG98_014743 [Punica granatum]